MLSERVGVQSELASSPRSLVSGSASTTRHEPFSIDASTERTRDFPLTCTCAARKRGANVLFHRSQRIDRKELGGAGRLYSWPLQASFWGEKWQKKRFGWWLPWSVPSAVSATTRPRRIGAMTPTALNTRNIVPGVGRTRCTARRSSSPLCVLNSVDSDGLVGTDRWRQQFALTC